MNIFITGVSSGVGYGLAKYYLSNGQNVYGISRNPNADLEAYDNFSFLAQDLTAYEELRLNIPAFLKDINKLDLVILNAGILNDIKDMKDTSLEEIRNVMDVNVWANKVLIDVLFENIDQIVQVVAISSGASKSGSRGWNAYSLSKATLNMLIDLYSKEQSECHFSALAPGLIDSNMQDYIYSLPDDAERKFPVVKKLKDAKGTKQMPSPELAAELIAESISTARKYESGSFLDVRTM